ncbi:MAG: metalloregulator ArsR/SmtB family transcription factor [Bacteroidales bacterium]|nr:metalloregulator ArsR/SmtB family transcription factor [Bacteroidales bacterium]MCF8454477.1 metalloregulator ArsR/SmtB family transcription factor [Bacteroidales bacterium]
MTKVELFESSLQEAAQLFKVLSHPARLSILKYLALSKTCISGDISEELPLSRTTVNQHLNELKNAGLIQGTIEGVKVNYCLNPDRINEVVETMNNFFNDIQSDTISIDNCRMTID